MRVNTQPYNSREGTRRSSRTLRLALPLLKAQGEGFVDEWQDTTTRNRCTDEHVEFLVASYGKLKMARRDTLHSHILRGVTSKLKHLSRQILENSSRVHCSFRTDTDVVLSALLQITMYTTDGELKPCLRTARLWSLPGAAPSLRPVFWRLG